LYPGFLSTQEGRRVHEKVICMQTAVRTVICREGKRVLEQIKLIHSPNNDQVLTKCKLLFEG
jgi:hypothetical protein